MAHKLYLQHQNLAIKEHRLRTSKAFAKLVSWDWHLQNNDFYYSESMVTILGIENTSIANNEKMPFETFFNFIHYADKDLVKTAIDQCLKQHTPFDIQHRLIKTNGEIVWVHQKGNVIYDEQENPLRMLGTLGNIDQQKSYERQLQHSIDELEQLKYALNQHAIVAFTDKKGFITYANDKFCLISGYQSDELMGETHAIVKSSYHNDAFYQKLWTTISCGQIWRSPICNRNKMGELYWVDTTIVPILNSDNEPDYYITIRTDITQLVETNNTLHVQAEALNAAADGIMITDQTGRIEWVNPAFNQLTGYQNSAVLGKTPQLFNSGRHEKQYFTNMWQTLLTGNFWHGEVYNRHADGHCYLEEQNITPVYNKDKELSHFIAIKRDITERKNNEAERQGLEKQLQQAQKMEAIGQLTGGIAHDFNNILASVLGYTELAKDMIGQVEQSKIVGYLEEVYKSGIRAKELIAQMLAFSRGGDEQYTTMNIIPLIKESIKMLSVSLPSSIEIKLHLNGNTELNVNMSPVQVHQVILNLCINARDAMLDRGNITISLNSAKPYHCQCASCHKITDSHYIEISVKDNGSGMTSETLHHLFEPFYTTKQVGKGSGMGLAMVHGIIHNHGGHILVDSQREGGSTFRLLIPEASKDEVVEQHIIRLDDYGQPLTTGHILVVDDDQFIVNYLAEMLRNKGYQVTAETNSQAALARFRKAPGTYDLVITDHVIPQLSGYELALAIQTIVPGIPIIICTAFIGELDSLDLGVAGVITTFNKPIPMSELLNTVAASLTNDANNTNNNDAINTNNNATV